MKREYPRDRKALRAPKPLSLEHQRILLAATVIGDTLRPYRGIDVRNFMGAEGRRLRTSAITQALRHIAGVGLIQQIGPGEFRKLPTSANTPSKIVAIEPSSFQSFSKEQLMAGKAGTRKPKKVDLEQPLWPEDAPK